MGPEHEENAEIPSPTDEGISSKPDELPAPSETGPPPPSTRLIVDRSPDVPALISVDSTSMSVQWSPVSITVKSNELRVVECLEAYALEMQQVEVHLATGLPEVKEERWSVQYSGPATYVQVKGLRPGRNYAVRVVCRPIVTDPEVIVETAAPSELLLVQTPATPPAAPAPPSLAVRQRNSLKWKWSEPVENGGHPILAYVVQCHPPPEGFEGQPTAEGMFEIYRGLEKSLVLKRLSPGIRYSVMVKAINCIGESPFSPVATFATQASVPSTPEAPIVSSSAQSSVVLRWRQVAGNGAEVTGYQVMMDDGQGGDFTFVGHTKEPQFALAGLRSGLSYRFRVQAENSEGRSQWSPHCIATTAATPPLAPPPPARESATHSSVTVTWRPPEYDGGSPLLKYELEMQPKCTASQRDMSSEWVLVYEGMDTSCSIGGLRAGCKYRVRARAVNAQGAGAYSFPADIATAAAIPEAPSEPTAASKMQDSLVLQWKDVEHDGGSPIMSYRLVYRKSGPVEQPSKSSNASPSPPLSSSSSDSFQMAYEGSERRAELTNLEPGMLYEFKVSASNKQGFSPWSPIAAVATKAGVPERPLPPGAHPGTAPRSLELQWSKPYGHGAPVNSYVVQMRHAMVPLEGGVQPVDATKSHSNGNGKVEAGPSANNSSGTLDDLLFNTVYHSSEPHCTVNNLDPNTEYIFRLRAFNSVGASPWSDHILAKTAPAPPSCPLNLRCSTSNQTTLLFQWDQSAIDNGATVSLYQLEYATVPRGAQRTAEKASWRSAFKGNALQHVIEDLKPGQDYQARVRGQNSCGWGPWSDICTAETQPDVPGSLQAPVASSRTGNSVRLAWSPPSESNGAAVVGYELQMAQGTDYNDQFTTLANDIATMSWKASELEAGTLYSFRVRAVNAVGAGPWSPLTTVTTSLLPPLEPTDLVSTVNEGSTAPVVIASWSSPIESPERSTCTSYEIESSTTTSTNNAAARGKHRGSGRGGGAGEAAKPTVIKHTCSGRVNQFSLTGLRAGATWSIRVRAIGADGAGHGAWSDSVTVKLAVADSSNAAAAAAEKDSVMGLAVGGQKRHKSSSLDKNSAAVSVTSGGDYGDDGYTKASHGRIHPRGGKAAVAKPKPRQRIFIVSSIADVSGLPVWLILGIFKAGAILMLCAAVLAVMMKSSVE